MPLGYIHEGEYSVDSIFQDLVTLQLENAGSEGMSNSPTGKKTKQTGSGVP